MRFLEKYHVVSMLGAGETNSFRAQEVATGRNVLVHQFVSGQPSAEQPDLISMIYAYLPGEGTPGTEHFLDSGQEENRVFIVTSDVPECISLRQWLQYIADSRDAGKPLPPAASASGQAPPAYSAAAEPVETAPVAPHLDPVAPVDLVAPVEPVARAEKEQPGEFTGMFNTPHAPAPAPAASTLIDDALFAAPAAPAVTPEAPKKTPGTFTSMFLAPTAASPNPPAATPPPPEARSEAEVRPEVIEVKVAEKRPRGQVPSGFQVVAQSRKPSQPAPPQEVVRPTAVASAPPQEVIRPAAVTPAPPVMPLALMQDEFSPTVLVQPPAPAPAPPASEPNASSGGFTGMFAAVTNQQTAQKTASPPPPAPKPPTAPLPMDMETTGAFTQMFEGTGSKSVSPPATRHPVVHVPPQTPTRNAAPLTDEPGEFTKMFKAPNPTANPPMAPPRAPVVNQPPVKPPAPAVSDGPGEFTAMFQSPVQNSPKVAPPQPPAGMGAGDLNPGRSTFSAPPAASTGPGEFTGLFKTGGEPTPANRSPLSGSAPSPTVPLSSSSKKGPGELTLLMQGYKSPTTPPPPPAMLDAPPPPPAPVAEKKGPGEFTMLFRTPNQQPAAPVSPVAPPPPPMQVAPQPKIPQAPGEYTSIFEAPRMPAAQPQAAAPPPPAPGYGYPGVQVTPPQAPQMPTYQPPQPPVGQITYPQMPQAPQYQPPPPPAYPMAPQVPQMAPVTIAPPQPAAPTGKKPMIFWILLMGLGCLFLAAVILVIFFAMKH